MADSLQSAPRPRPHPLVTAAAVALAAVLLYLSLRGIDWLRVWTVLRGASLPLVALVLAIFSVNLFARSLRWRVLLSAERRVTVPQAFWATSAGYLGNNVLPARAGELVRTLMICAATGMSRVYVLATALSERVVDALVLLSLSGVILLTLPTKPGWLAHAAIPVGVIGLAGVAAIVLVPLFEPFWERLLAALPVPRRLRAAAEDMLRQGVLGIRSFHDRGRLARFLLITTFLWSVECLTTILGARSLGISFSIPVAFLLIAGLGLGSALPSTPGYVGIYQYVAVSVLTPFGYAKSDAIAYILLFQAMNYSVLLVFGLIGFSRQRALAAQAPHE
jgi:uncharacterized protein (TIRG00374 family)